MTTRKKAALHNLGCKVNAYETDAMDMRLYHLQNVRMYM